VGTVVTSVVGLALALPSAVARAPPIAHIRAHLIGAIGSSIAGVAVAGSQVEVTQPMGEGAIVWTQSELARGSHKRFVARTNASELVTHSISRAIVRTVSNGTRLGVPRHRAVAIASKLSILQTLTVSGAVLNTKDCFAIVAHPAVMALAHAAQTLAVVQAIIWAVVSC